VSANPAPTAAGGATGSIRAWTIGVGVVELGERVIHGWASGVANTTRRVPHRDTAHLALIFSDAQLPTLMGVFGRGVEESTKKTTTSPAFGHDPHQHWIGKEARHEHGHCWLDIARQSLADNHRHGLYLAPRELVTIGQLILNPQDRRRPTGTQS
jgi:hypothetical protein